MISTELRKGTAMISWVLLLMSGCVHGPKMLTVTDNGRSYPAGTIIHCPSGEPTTFEKLMSDLQGAKVVYVGERHTDSNHHEIQLRIIEALQRSDASLTVGMEMFAAPYQPILDDWSNGRLDQAQFLEKVHWSSIHCLLRARDGMLNHYHHTLGDS